MMHDLAMAQINEKYGFIDRKGNWIIQPIYDELKSFDGQERAIAQKNERRGLIDKQGNWISETNFDGIFDVDDYGLYPVRVNDKFGFINVNGSWVLEPILDESPKFTSSYYNHDRFKQFNIVKSYGKFGILNLQLQWILKPEYLYLVEFEGDIFKAAISTTKYGFISAAKNEWIISPIFDYQLEVVDYEFTGFGAKYYPNGKIEFEGNWEDGELNGFGKEYYENGNLLYEGEWEYNSYNGKGIFYYDDGKYEGEFVDGEKDGKGLITLVNGEKYEVEFNSGEVVSSILITNINEGKPIGDGAGIR